MVRELLVFAVVFGLACWISRPNAEELMLKWRNGVRPLFRGIFWSIGLRLGTMAILFLIGILMVAAGSDPGALAKLRPDIEEVVNARALLNDPRYFILNLTLVSFVVGGLREELWRAGMLAGMAALFPQGFQTAKGKLAAAAFAAVVFGLGHLTQGWAG